ncbi:cytochrome o ubiquinol oxidase subunit IV [Shewanella morhuae]|uniref:Cytochrome bo(3) ubiquinol oxidase subunit 4 n=1 Tax=Shewanella morhuae TaxID=365591 RepID=A0A1N6UXF9_9GAMM|nr:cytochrome o ubiquinol oxidase subunit IV [Shewanella morhuae]PTA48767.1 cytochrome o ubiquinol oxidase subunit IV [Shewanella morhuae]GIU01784.1 cytochrome o ubiquinol oxidase subunit IV [Shewanella morhuae]SIQ70305.1 cytochrome bo3 quinol oxidase subunit 4 [Shewanella morhuae]SUI90821.1 Cytochrome o ubiquinol oxidase protein CyoD [Shewanella morhuae]
MSAHLDSHKTDDLAASIKSYLMGFVLSVILTAIPFWAVMTHHFEKSTTLSLVLVMAIVQIVVHLKYFLHLDFSKEGKINTFSFLFTALIIVMVVGLSVWIILEANTLMM